MSGKTIQFWFSIGSTYTYLSVARLEAVEGRERTKFEWRPFNVRDIMVEQKNVPFRNKPVKTAYMWRDIERRAAAYGLTLKWPVPYPLAELEFANRVALVGAKEGWCAAYTRATYRRWFVDGLEAGSEPNLSLSLAEIGQEPGRVVDLARSSEIGTALERGTNEAKGLGIFGSPTFVVGNEVFWGDDRLDDALAWSRR